MSSFNPPLRNTTSFNPGDFSYQEQSVSYAELIDVKRTIPVIGTVEEFSLVDYALTANTTESILTLPSLSSGTYLVLCTIKWTPATAVSVLMSNIGSVLDTFEYNIGFKSNITSGTTELFTRVSRVIYIAPGAPNEQWYITTRTSSGTTTTLNVFGQITRIA
jgi:hypothetical protein